MIYLENILVEQWYQPKKWGWILWPFTQIFQRIVKIRQYCYQKKIFYSYRATVPVIVVGNITVGGTGKTPLVIYLAALLKQQGLRPGIVLRGYKGAVSMPLLVQPNFNSEYVGDEAVLLAGRCKCPVVVAKRRVDGVKKLIQEHKVNIILCDDGLQHYELQRDLEIAVIDGERKFGNGYSLPMGPLRELPERLDSVDLTVTNGTDMHLVCDEVYSLLQQGKSRSLESFAGKTVHAIAGIGVPEKFFQMLRSKGITVIPHAFSDHHAFQTKDISFNDNLPILMTEKDAVKCRSVSRIQHWVVIVSVVLADDVKDKFCELVQGVVNGR